jgi:hypothetical protein
LGLQPDLRQDFMIIGVFLVFIGQTLTFFRILIFFLISRMILLILEILSIPHPLISGPTFQAALTIQAIL